MAKKAAISSNARRSLVVSLVNQGRVHSQQDLVELLADEGIEVTQATASRDLEEIGAVRGKDESGEMKYLLIDSSAATNLRAARVSDELVLSIKASGNLVVVKTPPGGAQLLASTLDRASVNGEVTSIIGTIAGDDTVLVISSSANGGKSLSIQLKNFVANGLNSKKARRR